MGLLQGIINQGQIEIELGMSNQNKENEEGECYSLQIHLCKSPSESFGAFVLQCIHSFNKCSRAY